MRVLVVEDEPAVSSYLVPLLERAGYEVEAVATGAHALHAVSQRRPDLVLLDVLLPDGSGLDVCQELRRTPPHLPVVMLTGLDSTQDELAGFRAKADDYITKPIVPEKLLARLQATLELAAAGTRGRQVPLGAVTVDLDLREARRDGRRVGLSAREFDLLAFLVEHPGRVFGKTTLLQQVWGADYDGDVHAVEVRISRVRAAVEDNPNRPRFLHTRHGVGYYLTLAPQ